MTVGMMRMIMMMKGGRVHVGDEDKKDSDDERKGRAPDRR